MAPDSLVSAYLDAKESVINAGYAAEIDWQDDLAFERITADEFLRQASWVIIAAGMRDSVVRRIFPLLSKAFSGWTDIRQICRRKTSVRKEALGVFNHPGKIDAILCIAEWIDLNGFEHLKARVVSDGVEFIQTLPYMGPATSYHLAKNLGLDQVKPDRHLIRVAQATRHRSPEELCRSIAQVTGERLSVIDLVIWRFATLDPDYPGHFASAISSS